MTHYPGLVSQSSHDDLPTDMVATSASTRYLRRFRHDSRNQSRLGRRGHHPVCTEDAGQAEHADPLYVCRDHVEMRYPQRPDQPALKDISLRIGAGQTHALCGSSGSGKSSIFALLQRFYDPSKGRFTFGGVDHRQLALADLRASMAYVSQDAVLFEGTIRWNLSLGALDPSSVTEDQLKVACEQA